MPAWAMWLASLPPRLAGRVDSLQSCWVLEILAVSGGAGSGVLLVDRMLS
jgi:hypothetical protein